MSGRVIALTGPPAGGKSTICSLFEDLGVPTVRTGDAVRERAHEQYDEPTEDDIWTVAQVLRDEHGDAGPTVACEDFIRRHLQLEGEPIVVVSGLREQAEVEWLESEFGAVLVVNIDTRNASERKRRYVDREIGNLGNNETPSIEKREQLRNELDDREYRERPYPRHHVTILNDDSIGTAELLVRLRGLCEFIDPDGDYSAIGSDES